MQNEIYRCLARVLDALPNKFPATESGVQLKMLAKLFTEEEASLACHMRLEAETASAIAAKAVTDPIETRNTLKRMMAKGLIDIRKGEGEFAYALRRSWLVSTKVNSHGWTRKWPGFLKSTTGKRKAAFFGRHLHCIASFRSKKRYPLRSRFIPTSARQIYWRGQNHGEYVIVSAASSSTYWERIAPIRLKRVSSSRTSSTRSTEARLIGLSRKKRH